MSFRTNAQHFLHQLLLPVVKIFIALGITPNVVTSIGVIINSVVAIVFLLGAERGARGDLSYVGWAGALILFAGLFDMIDGQVARLGNKTSRFGALYDSVMDRYSELIMFLGICYYLVAHHYFMSSIIGFIAMIGSMMVSYTRARAEGLGIPCKEGLMQRPERVITIGFSAMMCGIIAHYTGGNHKWHFDGFPFVVFESISIFTVPLIFVAVLSNYTAFQRLYICYVFLRNSDSESTKK